VIDTKLAVCDVHDMVIDPTSGCGGCEPLRDDTSDALQEEAERAAAEDA